MLWRRSQFIRQYNNGVKAGSPSFAGGRPQCKCASNPVEVKVTAQSAHNHVCGCTKCWKPAGALFSMVAVVPRDKISVTKNADRLKAVDPNATIQRHACTACGVHVRPHREHQASVLWARFHPHRAVEGSGWSAPEFAAFVSSIIRSARRPTRWERCARGSRSCGSSRTTASRRR